MPRLTSSVFRDLAIWMAGFGLAIGLVFPPFVVALGVAASVAISAPFVVSCVAAGLLVGGVNWALARLIVGRRLAALADRMAAVTVNVREAVYTGDWLDCQADRCRVTVDSADEIGRSARSFNDLVDALSESHDVEAAVSRFTNSLACELDVDRVVQAALGQLLAISGTQAGAILVVSDGEVRLRASEGLRDPGHLETSDHVLGVVRDREVRMLDLPDDVVVDGLLVAFRARHVLVAPLVFKSVVLGVVVLAVGGQHRFDGRRLIELLRPTLGLALNNAMAHERLQRLAAVDPLTDAYNRRFGLARLREEFSRAVRTGAPLGLVMLDIDRFKQVNDTYGHVVGDRVLRATAGACRRVLREGDVLVRYGGDELLAVLPGASRADAMEVAERLRRAAADMTVSDGSQVIGVTLSAGVASSPEERVDAETALVERADASLYEAKALGRNRVVVSGSAGRPASAA
jgi:diguanylate cyclase (GGDEF)-like protein